MIEETGNQNIVTAEDAAELMQGYEVFAKGMAVSLLCFIMSPISIFIAQMVYLKTQYMKEDSFGIIGVAITFVVIAFGVYKLVVSLQKNAKFKFIAEEEFTLSYGVKGIVEKAKMLHKKNTSKLTAFAISLYVLGIVPLLIFSIFDSEVLYLFGVVLLLIFVSIASAIVIRNAIINSSYNILLQLEDYSVDNKRFNKKLGAYMGALVFVAMVMILKENFKKKK